jgi:tellurite resistance protein TerC
MATLFPFHDYWGFYAGFTALVIVLLAIDLGLFHRKSHAVGFREALVWMCVWIALALLFCVGLHQYTYWHFGGPQAKQVALEFLTGYIVEESLSFDNMFVFVLVFRYFRIPNQYQHRVLFYGIIGALLSRGAFIALGAKLLQYEWLVILFGAFLIFTGIKLMVVSDQEIEPDKTLVMRVVRRFLPVTPDLAGQRLFVRQKGKRYATPLLLAIIFMEATDVLFAIDSVPAIFAVTREPFIVYTSNVFAILGLRSMYFLLADAIGRFYLLRYGLALVLVFIGLKMAWLNTQWDGHFPISLSLGVIGSLLAASIAISLMFPKLAEKNKPGTNPLQSRHGS